MGDNNWFTYYSSKIYESLKILCFIPWSSYYRNYYNKFNSSNWDELHIDEFLWNLEFSLGKQKKLSSLNIRSNNFDLNFYLIIWRMVALNTSKQIYSCELICNNKIFSFVSWVINLLYCKIKLTFWIFLDLFWLL